MKRVFELEARANETGYGITLRINGRAFDVIKLVQAAVSDAVCGMGADDTELCIAHEVERGIVAELVKGEAK